MHKNDVIATMNHLIETCKDGEHGFRTCADGVKSARVKRLLDDAAQRCAEAAAELRFGIVVKASGVGSAKQSVGVCAGRCGVQRQAGLTELSRRRVAYGTVVIRIGGCCRRFRIR